MPKEQPKFEKIVKGIERISPTKEELRKEEVLKFSPQEKTEQLWAFWSDYRRGEASRKPETRNLKP